MKLSEQERKWPDSNQLSEKSGEAAGFRKDPSEEMLKDPAGVDHNFWFFRPDEQLRTAAR
jgi:hypothetical protein